MAHCAEIVDGKVVQVIVVSNDAEPNVEAWATEWAGGGEWKQTSYNGKFRYNFAGIGYTYDPIDDAFIAPPICEHDELTLTADKKWECSNAEHPVLM